MRVVDVYLRGLLIAAAVAALLAACGRGPEFECYTKPRNGVSRECQLPRSAERLTACDRYGCFHQTRVFCFQGDGQRVCTPTREECDGWKNDWISVGRAQPVTVCFETGADGT